jgi:hypothetical protein
MHKKKRRGANSTRTHERHREAPLREARQAAPDWARASAALSSFNESSRFSRGPSRCDAKYGLFCYVITVLPLAAIRSLPTLSFDSKGAASGQKWGNCVHCDTKDDSDQNHRRNLENQAAVFPSGSSGGNVTRRKPRSQWTSTHSWSRRLRSWWGLSLCSSVSE